MARRLRDAQTCRRDHRQTLPTASHPRTGLTGGLGVETAEGFRLAPLGNREHRLRGGPKTSPKIFEIFRSSDLAELISRVAEDGGDPAGILIRVNERWSLEAIAALPNDREGGIVFLDEDRFALPVPSQPCREPVAGVEQPSIAGFGGEQDQLTNSGVRNASPGPNITAGRINLAEGKASSTAASP